MPPQKRRAAQREASSTSRHGESDPPSKRIRKNIATQETIKEVSTPTASSLLKDEDNAFPRGGAGPLTQLEHRQIKVQATKDALFEENGQASHEDENMSDSAPGASAGRRVSKNQYKLNRKSKSSPSTLPLGPSKSLRMEGLKTKHLKPGCLVLGQISRVLAHELTLDLPNCLSATVPANAVSPQLLARIHGIPHTEDSMDIDDTIDMRRMFFTGQYLRAAPALDEDDATNGSNKKRTMFTVDPYKVNGKMDATQLPIGSTLQASVASVEDHGLVMDLGLVDTNVRGFIDAKDIPKPHQLADIIEGTVFLCLVTGQSSGGKVVKLSAEHSKVGKIGKKNFLCNPTTINPVLPGTAVEVVVSKVDDGGITGTILGSLDATADVVHSALATRSERPPPAFVVGQKITARVIFALLGQESIRIGISFLNHILDLTEKQTKQGFDPLTVLARSQTVDESRVIHVEPSLGLFSTTTAAGVTGFVHISRVADDRIETLSATMGPYKTSTVHQARVIDYNRLDGLFTMSMQPEILGQAFLRVEDVTAGQLVHAKVEKIILKGGIVLQLAQGITGFVPEVHVSDVKLSDPSKKFKPGATVKARVLSVDLDRRNVLLSLRKTFVSEDLDPWTSYAQIKTGSSSTGTVTKVLDSGVVVHFCANVKGFIPKSELADSFHDNPQSNFPLGKSVRVIAKDIDANQNKLILSARSAFEFNDTQKTAFDNLHVGDLVAGTITAKNDNDVIVDLKASGLRATIRKGHLSDGAPSKASSALKKLRLGQTMNDLVVVEKFEKRFSVILSNKPKLVQAAKTGDLPTGLADIRLGEELPCYVRQITQTGVFVQIPGGTVGLLPITRVPDEMRKLPELGLAKDATITARVIFVDNNLQRFTLSLIGEASGSGNQANADQNSHRLQNPVDEVSHSIADFVPGAQTKARVVSIKDTQLNVELADGVQGRVDVSEAFDSWNDIKDPKCPLRTFKPKQILPVRVLGIHDARNHRFLPISHRQGKTPVFELSVRKSPDLTLSPESMRVGASYIGFVNNISNSSLWVHISPNVRGRVQLLDISTDPSVLQNLDSHYPTGSAVNVFVKKVDLANAKLDFTLAPGNDKAADFEDIQPGMSFAGRVTKVTERSVMVQLGETIAGQIGLTEIADDFNAADPSSFRKNQVVRVSVIKVDIPNKRVFLTTRPSKVLSSSLPVKDKPLSDVNQVKVNDLLRGFIKRVADVGVFITLGCDITAFVRVAELSDSYIKDWKSHFEIDRLVQGKVIAVDESSQHVQLSLKESVISGEYTPPLTFADVNKGQIVTGRIRKVEEYGAFIVVDNSQNVSGLCHRSQIADRTIDNVKEVLGEGDRVKAKVLSINREKRKISFGLKPSYFDEMNTDDSGEDDNSQPEDEEYHGSDHEDVESDLNTDVGSWNGIDLDSADISEAEADDVLETSNRGTATSSSGLDAGGFDWIEDQRDSFAEQILLNEEVEKTRTKPRKGKPTIKRDETGNLDVEEPQSKDDFERLLLTERDDSQLWMRYMAFHLELGEIEQARALADRALRTIHIREQKEKFNIWVALLNLESAYGSEESLEQAFVHACEHSDADDMHTAMADIHIQNNKMKKADDLFEAMAGKKSFRANPRFWESYAAFLFDKKQEANRARMLLERGLKSVLPHDAVTLTKSFAVLEFKRDTGEPERGRTIFEGLFNTYPKRWDLWGVLIDMEKGEMKKGRGGKENVSSLYERLAADTNTAGMKPSTAKSIFKQWLQWEEEHGKKKDVEKVKVQAAAFVQSRTKS